MKLYYVPTSSSKAAFIAAFATNQSIKCEQVSPGSHQTESGVDFCTINPRGVPCLVLDSGEILDEPEAILQFIADQVPDSIAPRNGTMERIAIQDLLSTLSIDLHAQVEELFNISLVEEVQSHLRSIAVLALQDLEERLKGDRFGDKLFIFGKRLTIADLYLYSILCCVPLVGIDLTSFPRLEAYTFRIASLPEVVGAEARMATQASTTC